MLGRRTKGDSRQNASAEPWTNPVKGFRYANGRAASGTVEFGQSIAVLRRECPLARPDSFSTNPGYGVSRDNEAVVMPRSPYLSP